MDGVNGLHHITAIAGPAQQNLDFYAGILGMNAGMTVCSGRFLGASALG